ncbi:hypothetical protein [uncultured Sanguibacteroides sp.]|uniref:hypothetical protein n=1 Tax=uncultured Sanguibacteroides sp. TaxID=1635151 RepID=UPI0025E490F9|nr:hypothetical protein [uncultured Sanguibacteroides sp.]
MRTKNILFASVVAILLLSGCDVKDPIYNTAHPEKGQITLTTDWSARTVGVDIPASYTVAVGKYSGTVSGVTNTLDNLFEPGLRHLRVYNTAEHISINEATVTVAPASGNIAGVGQFVEEMPGWLFTSALDAAIEADTDHELTAVMRQQVRQLTLFIEPTGSTAGKIERIEGYLTGVASTLNMDDDTHGTPLNATLAFTRVTEGTDAGKWAATVRLLGVAGPEQKLHAKIFFEGDTPKPVSLTDADGIEGCILTEALADFNKDKKTPLALGGKVVETPTGAGFTAIINKWIPVTGGPVVAE